MGNLAKQTFTASGSWTAPAGVTQVTVSCQIQPLINPTVQMNFNNLLVLDSNGNVFAWGENTSGALGAGLDPSVTNQVSSPVKVLSNLTFKTIANGRNNMLAITTGGQLYSWGDNTYGQLGTGSTGGTGNVSSPVAVVGGLSWSQALTAAYDFDNFCVGLTTNGKAYGWGYNGAGGLGIGNTTDQSSPVAVIGGLTFSRLILDGSQNTVFAQGTDGNWYSWGQSGAGLGHGNATPTSSPVQIVGGLQFTQLSSCNAGVIAITADGTPYAWGANTNGNLGLGDRTTRSSPVQVLGGLKFKQIQAAAGNGKCTFGLTTAGQLYAWGDNTTGNLGLGDTVPRSSPVAVVGGLTFQSFLSNGETTWALTTSGSMFSWGSNSLGELGDGTTTPRSSPVAVVGGLTFVNGPISHYQIDNVQAAFAYTSAGKLYAWGQNTSGSLGLGDLTPRSSPVAVLGSLGVNQFSNQNTSITLPVTPGTSYSITMSPQPLFGNNVVASLNPNQTVTNLVLAYEQ